MTSVRRKEKEAMPTTRPKYRPLTPTNFTNPLQALRNDIDVSIFQNQTAKIASNFQKLIQKHHFHGRKQGL
jgi:hypothetical protein